MNENAQDESSVTGKALGNIALVAGSAAAVAFAGITGVKGAKSIAGKFEQMGEKKLAKEAAVDMMKEQGHTKREAEKIFKKDQNIRKEGAREIKKREAFSKEFGTGEATKTNEAPKKEYKRRSEGAKNRYAEEQAKIAADRERLQADNEEMSQFMK